jgi:hypothetical protein
MIIEKKDIESIEIKDGVLTINAKNEHSVNNKIFIKIKNVKVKIIEKYIES